GCVASATVPSPPGPCDAAFQVRPPSREKAIATSAGAELGSARTYPIGIAPERTTALAAAAGGVGGGRPTGAVGEEEGSRRVGAAVLPGATFEAVAPPPEEEQLHARRANESAATAVARSRRFTCEETAKIVQRHERRRVKELRARGA